MLHRLRPSSVPLVGLAVHSGNPYHRRLLAGALDAVAARGWLPVVVPADPEGLQVLVGHGVDLVLCEAASPTEAKVLRSLGCPVVSTHHQPLGFPRVLVDHRAVGVAAGAALLATGTRHLAFAGYADSGWSHERRRGLRQAITDAGATWVGEAPAAMADLGPWLAALPRGTGLYAANDALAARLVLLAVALGRTVPRSLHILGTDDDELICGHARVPLSSLRLDLEGVGARAIALLEALRRGAPAPSSPVEVAGVTPVHRASTGAPRSPAAVVREARELIRRRAPEGLPVATLAGHLGLSRRAYERLCRAQHLPSPGRALREERLRQAMALLQAGGLTIDQVARRCGYGSATALGAAFRRVVGTTPGAWRAAHGASG